MWPYYPELLEKPVPRYTSYPTAAEFHSGVGAADYSAALDAVEQDAEVSLYVHIPFCERICFYCGCNTGAANKAKRLAGYLDALRTEVALVAERLGGRGRVTRIAFGGGSPNALAPSEFADLVGHVQGSFAARAAELSVELDPRALSRAWFDAIGSLGVACASLGVQTLDARVQRAIGRIQPEESIEEALAGLRASGVASVNFDLMYGLPGQSLHSLLQTLAAATRMAPDRIALFGYAHVPHLVPRQRRIDGGSLPAREERFVQAAAGYDLLTGRGYEAVGFDHFAQPADPLAAAAREGKVRRNFQGFTDDTAEVLIGLGASAISRFPNLLVQNEKNAGRYGMMVSGRKLASVRGIVRDRDEQRRSRLIEDILCRGEADTSGISLLAALMKLRPFQARDLIAWSGSRLRLAPEALPYARAIASAFDAHRDGGEARFSNAV
jgi:oxygen-independent coproporphyrinogen-3 oxidase